jgi:hypothetical protein
MFVNVYECMEKPECLIPSFVGLHCLEFGDYRIGNLVLAKGRDTFLKASGIVIDREIGLIGALRRRNEHSLSEGSSDLPHDVIKRTSSIVETIPNDCTEAGIGIGGDLMFNTPIAALILDRCDKIFLRLQVPVNFEFQGVEVFLCPDDFEACSV